MWTQIALDLARDEMDRARAVAALAEIVDGQDTFNEAWITQIDSLKKDLAPIVRAMLVKLYAKLNA